MSRAAMQPLLPPISPEDRNHPLFPSYMRQRENMAANNTELRTFKAWRLQQEAYQATMQAREHPQYPEFLQWMKEHKGGARPCPTGVFPRNFEFWLNGGRW
jgi:hypothetical protein